MSSITKIMNFCTNPSLNLAQTLNLPTKLLFISTVEYCIKNNKGNVNLAQKINNILNNDTQIQFHKKRNLTSKVPEKLPPLRQLYLNTEQRVYFAQHLQEILKDYRQDYGVHCVNGPNPTLLEYIKLKKKIGQGFVSHVYEGCTPLPCTKDSYKFAVKLTKIDPEILDRGEPFSPFGPVWHEYIILKDISNKIIEQGICPNLPYLISAYICNDCDFDLAQSQINKNIWGYSDRKSTNIPLPNPCLILFSELSTGGDLEKWFNIPNKSPDAWYSCLFQIMAGLHALQVHGQVVNNDIKAPNILSYQVKPGGFWHYIINGIDFYVPNHGNLFVINDFGIASVFSPDFCLTGGYECERSSETALLGQRFAMIINGKFSPLQYKPFKNGIQYKPIFWGDKTNETCPFYSQIDIKMTSQVYFPRLKCLNKKIISRQILFNKEQLQALKIYNIKTNTRVANFYQYPELIPPLEFTIDTQDAIRCFTGGPCYKQQQQRFHEKPDQVPPDMLKLLESYLIHDTFLDSSDNCYDIFPLSPKYNIAGYFIEDFFTKAYPNYTKLSAQGKILATYHISGAVLV